MNIFVLTMLFPLLGFVVLSVSQGRWSKNVSASIGVGSIGISALITVYILFDIYSFCIVDNFSNFILFQEFCSWFKIENLNITIAFRLDILSLMMLLIIVGVGLIIHLYAAWYMGESGYSRFFAYTNLFMANMILLVLSDNLLLMYFGWEGVGLCSYLLIGFYYSSSNNGLKAIKAFIMTRFGDICLICALFMIYDQYNTLSLHELLKLEPQHLLTKMSSWISIMLLIGAIGKSAQLPLQSWLVSAMVGPTPVSALIHAATMVTSGIYLIHRMHNFFMITPGILYLIGIIGSIGIVIFSCSALCQSNIKKILAYSTISQIGYMFVALGSENWNGAIFHLMTHAFFKALLFLVSGSLIKACQDEQNIFKMGALYKSVPFLYACFVIGGASLSGFPVITAGFYSKELILTHVLVNHYYLFLFFGLIGIFLTSMYTFRMIFIIFHGKKNILSHLIIDHTICQYFPLVMLSLLSTFIGGSMQWFLSDQIILHGVSKIFKHDQMYLLIISSVLVALGIWLSSIFWLYHTLKTLNNNFIQCFFKTWIRYLILLSHYGWGIDKLYSIVIIKPYLFISKKIFYYGDPIRILIHTLKLVLNWLMHNLLYIENGKLSWCLMSINVGVVIVLIFMFIMS